jgi:hypothetical protein
VARTGNGRHYLHSEAQAGIVQRFLDDGDAAGFYIRILYNYIEIENEK